MTKLRIGRLVELNIARPSVLELGALALVLLFALIVMLSWQ